MTVGEIAFKVAWNLTRPRTDFLDQNNGGADMLISAINDVRLDAERRHDWLGSEGQTKLSVDPANGGDMGTCLLYQGDTASAQVVRMKGVTGAYLLSPTDAKVKTPLKVVSKGSIYQALLEQSNRYVGGVFGTRFDSRYPGDIQRYQGAGYMYEVYWQGNRLFTRPRATQSVDLILDGQIWMPSYLQNKTVSVETSDTASTSVVLTTANTVKVGQTLLGQLVSVVSGPTSLTLAHPANQTIASTTVVPLSDFPGFVHNEDYTDWMTQDGADYLMWGAVCALNPRMKEFVMRSEGGLTAPTKERDNAFATMETNDNYARMMIPNLNEL